MINALTLLVLVAPYAGAIENLDGQRTRLTVVPGLDVPLRPEQIALRGRLDIDLSGPTDIAPYVVIDTELAENILPDPWVAHFPLAEDDYVIVLERGDVLAQGLYHEVLVDDPDDRGHGLTSGVRNQPRLFKNPARTKVALPPRRFTRAFERGYEAVVIQRLDVRERTRRRTEIEPWILRAQDPASRETRLAGLTIPHRSCEEALRGRLTFKTVAAKPGRPGERALHFERGPGRAERPRRGRLLLLDDRDLLLETITLGEASSLDEPSVGRAHSAIWVRPRARP